MNDEPLRQYLGLSAVVHTGGDSNGITTRNVTLTGITPDGEKYEALTEEGKPYHVDPYFLVCVKTWRGDVYGERYQFVAERQP
jgi:hypothetical protein